VANVQIEEASAQRFASSRRAEIAGRAINAFARVGW
jgi:hypothetical protein